MELEMERRRAQGLEQALAFQRQQFLNEKQKAPRAGGGEADGEAEHLLQLRGVQG